MIKISGKNKNIVILGSTILIALLVVLGAASYNIYQDKVKEERKQEYSFIFEGSKDPLSDRGTGSFQSKIDKKLKDDFDSNHYSLEKAKVVVNPYEISPLTALIMFETDKETAVTLTITGLHNDDIVKTFTKTKKHFVPVYGLYANKETKVTIKLDNGKTNSFLIKGGEVPKTAKEMTVLDNKVKLNNEMYLFTSPTGVPNIAYDNYGNVRWYLNMGYSKGVTVLRNGNLLLSNEKMGQDPTSNGGAVEVNLLGKVYNEYEIKGGYHHDAIELPSDNLLIPTTNIESGRTSDFIVEIDRKTGKEVNSFDLFDMINKIDPEYAKTLSSVWAWNNSVFYNKNTNELLVSLRNRNAIISIDYTKKTINWILSDPKNFSNKFESYLLKPTGKDFIYPFGQHSVKIDKNNNLTIFNNGYDAKDEKEISCSELKDLTSYAMSYKIDANNKTAETVWKYGNKDYFSYALSSFEVLDNSKIINFGWNLEEMDAKGCTQFGNSKQQTFFIELNDKDEILFRANIKEGKFEAIKTSYYNNDNEYEIKDTKYLSTVAPTDYKKLSYSDTKKYKDVEVLPIDLQFFDNRIKMIGAIPFEMSYDVVLINELGEGYRFNYKQPNKLEKNFVDVSKIKGRYAVYIEMGDDTYNTSKYVNIK